MTIPPPDLAAIRARFYAKGPGPFTANKEAICLAFSDIPALIDYIDALKAEHAAAVARLEERASLAEADLDGRGRAGCDFCAAVPTTPIPTCHNCFDDHHELRKKLAERDAEVARYRMLLVAQTGMLTTMRDEIQAAIGDGRDPRFGPYCPDCGTGMGGHVIEHHGAPIACPSALRRPPADKP